MTDTADRNDKVRKMKSTSISKGKILTEEDEE